MDDVVKRLQRLAIYSSVEMSSEELTGIAAEITALRARLEAVETVADRRGAMWRSVIRRWLRAKSRAERAEAALALRNGECEAKKIIIAQLEAALATARRDALEEAVHLMPRYFGVWSSTGVHIGVWDDGATAAKVLGEYSQGVMRDLIDAEDIRALANETIKHNT